MSFAEKVQNKKGRFDPKELQKLLKIAYELKNAMDTGSREQLKLLEQSKGLLAMLLEYLILNIGNPDVDVELINLLSRFLGFELSEEIEDEIEEEKEKKLSKEEKERRHRLMVYEVYKIISPRRLAGETDIDNFINNVRTRGVSVAVKYEGREFAKYFDAKELSNLESHSVAFRETLVKAGFRGGGIDR